MFWNQMVHEINIKPRYVIIAIFFSVLSIVAHRIYGDLATRAMLLSAARTIHRLQSAHSTGEVRTIPKEGHFDNTWLITKAEFFQDASFIFAVLGVLCITVALVRRESGRRLKAYTIISVLVSLFFQLIVV